MDREEFSLFVRILLSVPCFFVAQQTFVYQIFGLSYSCELLTFSFEVLDPSSLLSFLVQDNIYGSLSLSLESHVCVDSPHT